MDEPKELLRKEIRWAMYFKGSPATQGRPFCRGSWQRRTCLEFRSPSLVGLTYPILEWPDPFRHWLEKCSMPFAC
jgi:hypothetical protein